MSEVTDEVQWDGSRPAYVQLPEWLLFHPDLSDGAKMTWLALASYADKQGTAFPGVKTLAKRRGRGAVSIFNHLRELEEAGALRRSARYRDSDGGRTSTLYALAWAYPFLATPDRVPDPEPPATDVPDEPVETPLYKKLKGGPPYKKLNRAPTENRTGPPTENCTPRTKPNYEQTPIVPTKDDVATDTSRTPKRTSAPKGTSPPSDSPDLSSASVMGPG